MLRVTSTRRVYVLGLRIHHGPVGLALLLIGLWLLADDWHDRPWPLVDRQ